MPAIPLTKHLSALDAGRGIAALAVFGYHLKAYFGGLPWLQGSFLAVDLFFIMSGFVIARSYENRLRAGKLGLSTFVRVRVIRLYPLYLLACGIGFAYFAVKMAARTPDAPSVLQMLASFPGTLLLLPSPFTSSWGFTPFPFAPSAWSLALEFWFNIVYAALVIRFRVLGLVVLTVLSWLFLIHQALSFGSLDLGWNISTTPGGIARFWFSFTLGVLIYRLHRPNWVLPPIMLLCLVPVFAFVAFPPGNLALGAVWITLVFPAALVIGAAVRADGLTAWISDHLGRLSYGIYILHAPVVLFLTGVFKVVLGDAWENYLVLIGWAIVATVLVVSALATYLFDEPLRRALQPKRPQPVGAETTPAH
jgi:peptidoglycan/LPS O-acetylase OafA/YrhL